MPSQQYWNGVNGDNGVHDVPPNAPAGNPYYDQKLDVDDEKAGPTHVHEEIVNEDRLRRSLSARMVNMIAIGGTIGTGRSVVVCSVVVCACEKLQLTFRPLLGHGQVARDGWAGKHANRVRDCRRDRVHDHACSGRDERVHSGCRVVLQLCRVSEDAGRI
jgi:hypothetical protein